MSNVETAAPLLIERVPDSTPSLLIPINVTFKLKVVTEEVPILKIEAGVSLAVTNTSGGGTKARLNVLTSDVPIVRFAESASEGKVLLVSFNSKEDTDEEETSKVKLLITGKYTPPSFKVKSETAAEETLKGL